MTAEELQVFNQPGIVKKEDLAPEYGGAPVRPQITSPDNRSSSDRRYLRRQAEWNSTREREIADEERARTYQRQDVADEMNQKKMMLDEANSLIAQESRRADLEHQAAMARDTLGFHAAVKNYNVRDDLDGTVMAEIISQFPNAPDNSAVRARMSSFQQQAETIKKANEAVAAKQVATDERNDSRIDADLLRLREKQALYDIDGATPEQKAAARSLQKVINQILVAAGRTPEPEIISPEIQKQALELDKKKAELEARVARGEVGTFDRKPYDSDLAKLNIERNAFYKTNGIPLPADEESITPRNPSPTPAATPSPTPAVPVKRFNPQTGKLEPI